MRLLDRLNAMFKRWEEEHEQAVREKVRAELLAARMATVRYGTGTVGETTKGVEFHQGRIVVKTPMADPLKVAEEVAASLRARGLR